MCFHQLPPQQALLMWRRQTTLMCLLQILFFLLCFMELNIEQYLLNQTGPCISLMFSQGAMCKLFFCAGKLDLLPALGCCGGDGGGGLPRASSTVALISQEVRISPEGSASASSSSHSDGRKNATIFHFHKVVLRQKPARSSRSAC